MKFVMMLKKNNLSNVMTQIPYWLTINSNIQGDITDSEYLSFFNTNSVRDGESPLNEYGKVFVDMVYSVGFPPNDKIWVFPKASLNNEYSHQVGQLFVLLMRIKSDIALCNHGTITIDDYGVPVDWQPPNPTLQETRYTIRKLLLEDTDDTFLLAKNIAERSLFNECFNQLSYLKELRCTDPFLGYLGLWSFIEIEWADNPQKTDMKKSLKSLLDGVFHDKREFKKAFNTRLKDISAEVGRTMGEYSIRNLLAHGKYHKVSNNWDGESTSEFHAVHDELYRIMLEGLGTKIMNNT